MTGIELAIKKAIEGGWKGTPLSKSNRSIIYSQAPMEVYVCDPSFWQALGKAEGWEGIVQEEGEARFPTFNRMYCYERGIALYHWHRFIDWISAGNNPDDFFNSLLKQND